ncbi:MAG: carbohydrate porin [Puniceicoccales bacterium]|jgi:porin|nr:carbohydrate porin [Puniceicoccales bacterium]
MKLKFNRKNKNRNNKSRFAARCCLAAAATLLAGSAGTASVFAADAASRVADTPATGGAADAAAGATTPAEQDALHGFKPFLSLYGEAFYNAAGGVKNTGWWNTLADFGFEQDLAKLGAPDGLSLHFNAHWVENRPPRSRSFADATGAANPVSGIHAADHLRVFNLHLAQTLAGDRLVLKLGQLAADDEFAISDHAGFFLNSSFGAMPSQCATPLAAAAGGNAAFPIYAVAAPGLFAAWKINDALSLAGAVYYGGPGADTRSNYGFSYENASNAGAAFYLEAAWTTTVAGGRATILKLGANAHTGRFDDFKRDATARGFVSFWLAQDLALIPAKSSEPPVLGLFWRAGYAPLADRSVVAFYADAGVVWNAPLPPRPDDALGLAVAHTRYTRAFRRADGTVAASETTVELSYRAVFSEHFSIQADLQLLLDPLRRDDAASRHPALVPGVRAVLSF